MDLQGLKLAVVGATGAVGQETLRLIEERYPQHKNLKLLASKRSAGRKVGVNGATFTVSETTDDSFDDVDIAFISASTEASRHFGPIAAQAGAMVIDDSSAFRMDPEVPLVVPEVNGDDLDWHDGIVAIPNCSTTPAGDGGASVASDQPDSQDSRGHLPVGVWRGRRGDGRTAGANTRHYARRTGRGTCPAASDRVQRVSAH